MLRITEGVKVLIIVNVLVYIGCQSLGEAAYSIFAMHFPMNPKFGFWQVLTHMFMHDMGSFSHILFNMLMLFFIGSPLEESIGKKRFFFIYFSAGLGATGLSLLINYLEFYPGYMEMMNFGLTKQEVLMYLTDGQYPTAVLESIDKDTIENMFGSFYTSSVGASGAIYGIMAAYAVLFPNRDIYLMFLPMPIKVKYLIGIYFGLNLISALSGTAFIGSANTGFWAHIGGAIIGFIVMWYWKKNSFNNRRLY